MKKLITLAVGAALSTSALAGANTTVFGDVSQINKKDQEISVTAKHNNQKETGLQGHFKMENGLIIGAETKYDWTKGDKGIKESSIGAAYRFNINDNFYVMPQAIYTHSNNKTNDITGTISDEQTETLYNGSYEAGKAYELAIQTGYHMDNGFFVAGRYGYGQSKDKMSALAVSADILPPEGAIAVSGIGFEDTVKTHKLDLTAGYEFSNVAVISATYTAMRTADDIDAGMFSASESGATTTTDKLPLEADYNQLQVKASYLGFGNVKPFVAYTAKGDYKFTGASKDLNPAADLVGKAENVVEVGVTVSF